MTKGIHYVLHSEEDCYDCKYEDKRFCMKYFVPIHSYRRKICTKFKKDKNKY